ncbi:hypothetical protein [Subtercola endophyticus]|uniref:hypothetical protein n=1 Tax=Subtercola endophyticus TaxID=2895559 RepID=UPI001E60D13C|nr:hypothetical protein [Subtercola endophyticus]UFS57603.1 hypothetical protein LQ955_11075 [Subtercola endophyticus]
MPTAECTLLVAFKPNVVNGWFLRLFAQAFAEVNREETACTWGGSTSIVTPAGPLHLTTFVRYRGTRVRLGSGSLDFMGVAGASYTVVARNGAMNQTPFTPTLVPDEAVAHS